MKILKLSVFEQLKNQIKEAVAKVEALSAESGSRREEWLDNQDVCQLLGISHRTLQYYRSRGLIAYTMVGHKTYYHRNDLDAMIEAKTVSNNKNE